MKRLVTVEEVEGEGLAALLGKTVQLWCVRYIYAGKLVGVNEHDVMLEDAFVVYETGPLQGPFADAQPTGRTLYVRTAAIESYSEAPA